MAKANTLLALIVLCVGIAAFGQESTTEASATVPPIESAPVAETIPVRTIEDFYAERGGPPWYQKAEMPSDLHAALVDDVRFLTRSNVGYHMMGDRETCTILLQVQLGCDYNTRTTLSMFLTVNGKGLFPAAGGTNPYFSVHDQQDRPDDYFIGQPVQNRMLREAVARNAALFHDGNLTAADVRSSWQ